MSNESTILQNNGAVLNITHILKHVMTSATEAELAGEKPGRRTFFLSNESTIPHNNGLVLNIAHIIKHVMTSAIEAELAALYIMAREAVYILE